MRDGVLTVFYKGEETQVFVDSEVPKVERAGLSVSYGGISTRVMARESWMPIRVHIVSKAGRGLIERWLMDTADMMTGRGGYASSFKADVKLEYFDPQTGMICSSWRLAGTFITEFDVGVPRRRVLIEKKDNSNADLGDFTMTYDRAWQEF